jgi:hypothetical protein
MDRYHTRVRLMQNLQTLGIVILLIAGAVFLYIATRPEIIRYDIPDECGPIGGSISHTLDDADSCQNACNAYCLSLKHTYETSRFELVENACNTCECYCEE